MGFHWVGMRSALRCLYLAFFTVVASRPNLSTFIIIAKIVTFQSIYRLVTFQSIYRFRGINKHKKPFYLTLQRVSISCLWCVKSLPKFSDRVV